MFSSTGDLGDEPGPDFSARELKQEIVGTGAQLHRQLKEPIPVRIAGARFSVHIDGIMSGSFQYLDLASLPPDRHIQITSATAWAIRGGANN